MEKSNFDDLLERYMKDKVSEEEKVKIEAWLDSVKTKGKKDFKWDKQDEEELFKKIVSNQDNLKEILGYKPRQGKARSIRNNRFLPIAASFLLLVVISFGIWNLKDSKPAIFQGTSVNQIDKVILNDGTIVWLKPKSKLTYSENQNNTERHAKLSGEGLFEVTKDVSRPFIIDCGEIKVKVLGTSFNLKSENGIVELEVLTGRVNLSSPTNQEGIDVGPNDKVIYDGKSSPEKNSINLKEIEQVTKLTEYNMQFKNTPMDQIISRIEKKFNVNFQLDDDHINKCKITADFTDRSLETTLQMISEVLDFEYKISGSTVTVIGSGCQ